MCNTENFRDFFDKKVTPRVSPWSDCTNFAHGGQGFVPPEHNLQVVV
jgi:hypothetical protein